jgi:hypothetical protein
LFDDTRQSNWLSKRIIGFSIENDSGSSYACCIWLFCRFLFAGTVSLEISGKFCFFTGVGLFYVLEVIGTGFVLVY